MECFLQQNPPKIINLARFGRFAIARAQPREIQILLTYPHGATTISFISWLITLSSIDNGA
ncbi:hypothetical protein WA1_50320 [Scytonema hofmannii PCC 7110]|uniref:Uncharacterized protein n=1 Tax=Scytonema hofmannii PCC 7110 TaxID=128403 RepID=A0A139WR62_9CYAN|nr:hypothetical protein [Scytonema hofmannii]KYC34922.1 hypothetical protein WA1_50320 [Scytonema hofmannii PCC 7110]